MKVAFLYPGTDRYDALAGWVAALRRHARGHDVYQATTPAACATGPRPGQSSWPASRQAARASSRRTGNSAT
jgi:hypothetical protein